jgi:hypothetical protein
MADKDIGPRIGADPEIFVQNAINKEVVPICGHIGGSKKQPINLTEQMRNIYGEPRDRRGNPVDTRGNYAVQEDNVMLEFNVPACLDEENFTSSISRVMDFILATYLLPKNLTYKFGLIDANFKKDVLDKYPQAHTIGCDPDFNAYAEDGRFKREPYSSESFGTRRFCGGHIHVQYDTDLVPQHIFAQFMDAVACLPYLHMDKQKGRRQFYGQPGLFRPKDYGIEYRTLSSFWLQPRFRSDNLWDLSNNILNLARMANQQPQKLLDIYPQVRWDDIKHAIRTEDEKLALALTEHNRGLGLQICQVGAA